MTSLLDCVILGGLNHSSPGGVEGFQGGLDEQGGPVFRRLFLRLAHPSVANLLTTDRLTRALTFVLPAVREGGLLRRPILRYILPDNPVDRAVAAHGGQGGFHLRHGVRREFIAGDEEGQRRIGQFDAVA